MLENYDVELIKYISDQLNYFVEKQIHLNTWMIERGYARQDLHSAGGCN